MKISYAITFKDEIQELDSLLSKLHRWLAEVTYDYEIVILQDTNAEGIVLPIRGHKVVCRKFDGSFAEHKNFLTSKCHGEFIFQIDADEYPSTILVQEIGTIIEQNPTIDLYWVPRVNTVYGLTHTHVQMWGWQMSTLENVELSVVNWPDYQGRIYRNDPLFHWEGKVHEQIKGVRSYTKLPAEQIWALFHPKTISRQVKQNEMYSKMQR